MNIILLVVVGMYACLVLGSIMWEKYGEDIRAAIREEGSKD